MLMHSQTQLMNTEVSAHADTRRGTGRNPQRQAQRKAQTLPPQDPFKTDRQNQTLSIPTVTGTYASALETHVLLPEHASIIFTHL